ncbi:hypothetical protein [Pantoea piersonii]|jgi:hypothetical protein|uniref:hypothetical protein n=1 Tax=Pantoea piersonii TaxID=2364647 RepID=UPI0015C6609F|nr:hypothetical protein [Pantoea piersonii]MBZ6385161.1 hypothetical protein [Pantoea piersonii]MBZ6385237.1 hypothetical protein [Pantoea piersonii]MBZ6398689.1 hypothetical protein [Pantoea piersonii]MBZ6398765.1 hypothetical protein [Pantoea piersonii]MBZ6406619.1 hypothetical protein [Pantoea piersonii]
MQTSSQPKLLPIPFADSGSKQSIPNTSQIGITAGRASYPDGFPPLTRTPLAAGGVPPFGVDFNGVLNDVTAAIRWEQAGAGYPFDSAFSSAINGYPKGAVIPNSTGDGYWLNTIDGNTNNPEVTTGALTGWVPTENYGVTSIAGLSSSSITLTSLQASKDRIKLSGTLTTNINVVVPAWNKKWTVVNNCSGGFSVTIKTPSGSGVAILSGMTAVVIGDGTNIYQDTNVAGIAGRLLNVKYITASGTYTPTTGTNIIFVQGLGTGGNGAGSTATGSTGCTCCSGGASGGYAEAWYTSGFSSVSVTIGAIGALDYASGSAGGTSNFGSLMVIPGGGGGGASGQASSVAYFENGGGAVGGRPTLSGHISGITTPGTFGQSGKIFNGVASSGQGASSKYGTGGANTVIGSGGSAGGGADGYGAGGGGAGVSTNSSAVYGGNATKGLFIVWEYT